jgi:hypothetical protein
MNWLLAHPLPLLSPVSKSSLFLSISVCRRLSLLTGDGGGGDRQGAKSYGHRKAWSSIYHSILSAPGWQQLTVETEVNGSFAFSCRYKIFLLWLGPVQNIFCLTVYSFNSFVSIAQQAGQAAVLGRLSLSMCRWWGQHGAFSADELVDSVRILVPLNQSWRLAELS